MGKKISAVITAPGHEPYRAHFQETEDADQAPIVAVWTAGSGCIGFLTSRFNGGVFSRDWVRALYDGSGARVEF